jgi:hypothetical protein
MTGVLLQEVRAELLSLRTYRRQAQPSPCGLRCSTRNARPCPNATTLRRCMAQREEPFAVARFCLGLLTDGARLPWVTAG